MDKNINAFYMINGLIIFAERVSVDGNAVQVRQALALTPGQQQGQMSYMEAFPFTSMDEVVTLQNGTFMTNSPIADQKVIDSYLDALTQIRSKKAGIILP